MAASEIHVDDLGTQFILTIKDGEDVVDLSTTSVKQILFHKPDGTILTKDATYYTDGTDGKIYYATVDGDLDLVGSWRLQAYIGIGSSRWHSDIARFTVHPNLE